MLARGSVGGVSKAASLPGMAALRATTPCSNEAVRQFKLLPHLRES
jgi:hypothetical protein